MAIKFLSGLNLSNVTAGSILKLDSNGNIVAATAGTDYAASNIWSTASSDNIYYSSGGVRIGTYQTSVDAAAKLHVFDYQTTDPKLLIEDGNTGDASMQFKISTQSYTMGIDNSDSDKFILAASSALGTTNVLEIATNGASAFQKAVLFNETIYLPGNGQTADREKLIDAHGTRATLYKQSNAAFWQVAQGGNQFEIVDGANGNDTKGNVMLRVDGRDANDNEIYLAVDGGKVGIGTTSPEASMHIESTGDNGSAGLSDYGFVVTSNSTNQPTLGAESIGDGYANLNLGSNISGTRTFWHISKRKSTDSHQLEYYYYNGTGFDSKFTFRTNGSFLANELDLPSGGQLDWANGDARIVEGLVSNYSLSFQTYTGEALTTKMFVSSGGNVGIGTTAPLYPVVIAGRGPSGQEQRCLAIGNTNNSGTFMFLGTSATTGGYSVIQSIKNEGVSYGDLILQPDGGGVANVGIGTTAPSQKLDVSGNAYVSGYVQAGTALMSNKVISSSDFATFGSNASTRGIALSRDFNPSLYPDLIINSSGNVGLGTASPGYKLEVAGVVQGFGAVRVNSTSTGSPYFGLYQNGSEKAYMQYVDGTTDSLVIQSDGKVSIRGDVQYGQGETAGVISFLQSTTEIAKIDQDGYMYAAGFKVGTGSGVLRADGSTETITFGTMASASTGDYKTSDQTETYVGQELGSYTTTSSFGTNAFTSYTDHSTQGYLTSYTETDTLDSVTGRGATTTNNISVGNLSAVGGTFTDPVTIYDSTTTENPRLSVGRNAGESIEFDVTDVVNTITAKQDSDSDGDHFFVLDRVFAGSGDSIFRIHNDGTPDLTIDGNGVVTLNQYGTAGILQINTSGTISVDTNTYSTASGVADNADAYGSWTVSDGTNTESVTSGTTVAWRGSGATSVSYDVETNQFTISSTNTEYSNATTSVSGLMSSTDKTKLDSVATNADVTPSWVPATDPSYLTSLPSHNHDDRYYTESEIDDITHQWEWKWQRWTSYLAPAADTTEAWTTYYKTYFTERTEAIDTTHPLQGSGYVNTITNVGNDGGFGGSTYGNIFGDLASYHCHIYTNIYVDKEFTVNITNFNGDDPHAIFIDGKFVHGKIPCCTDTAYNYTFKQGWHRIDLIYSEGGGGDWIRMGWNPKNYLANISDMTPHRGGENPNYILDKLNALGTLAPLASPALTGTPTAPTAGSTTNTTQIATTAFVQTAVSNLVDSAPSTLDTLNELAAALGDDPNFATTVTNSIATKLPLAGGILTGDLNLTYGYPRINFFDTTHDSDYSIINNNGSFSIYDITNNSHRLSIASNGNTTFAGTISATGGTLTGSLSVTGKTTSTDQISVNNRTAISVGHWSASSNTTGAIKITLPGSHSSNWSMLVLRITAYEYNSTNHTIYYVSGHDWTSGWYNNGVTKMGDSNKDIKLGWDSNKDYVILGGVSDTWSYGHVTVDVMAQPSFYNNTMDITSGWDVRQTTDLTGITTTAVTNKKVLTTADEGSGNGIDADTVDGIQGGSLLRSDANDTASGIITFTNNAAEPLAPVHITGGGNHTGLYINPAASKQAHVRFATNGTLKWQIRAPFQDGSDTALKFYSWVNSADQFTFNHSGDFYAAGDIYANSNKVATETFVTTSYKTSDDTETYVAQELTGYTPTSSFGTAAFTASTDYLGATAKAADSNLLDGIDSTGFVKQLGITTDPDFQTPSSRRLDPNTSNPTNDYYAVTTFGNGSNVTGQLATHFQTGQLYSRGYNSSWSAWKKYATESFASAEASAVQDNLDSFAASLGSAASASTTDFLGATAKAADSNLLDGLDSGSFLRSDAADTATGEILFDAGFKSDPIMLSGSQNFDNISRSGFYNLYNTNTGSTNSPGFDYGTMIVVGNNKQGLGFGFQLAHERLNSAGKFRVRGMNDTASAWSSWAIVWTSSDFANNSANWNTAYGWGNHADASYIKSDSVEPLTIAAETVTFSGSVTVEGTFTESSSIRFKENITSLDPALDKVNQLEAVSYNKTGVDDREIGLIAEDVAELFPEVVTYNEEGQPQGIQYQRLSVILLKAMQELSQEVNELKKKLN